MIELNYTVSFTTPAFLGNAEQSAQWRTPPFKALLRQWWRVAWAAERGSAFDHSKMRHNEGLLFGHAWLKDDVNDEGGKVAARRSEVRIRLEADAASTSPVWDLGAQEGVTPLPVTLDTSYAWFGLVKRGDGLPDRTAIKTDGTNARRTLCLAVPNHAELEIVSALRLCTIFGQLGSRSRGGWGSVALEPTDAASNLGNALSADELTKVSRPLAKCIDDDWAQSLASHNGALLFWESKKGYRDWPSLMKDVAMLRREVRSNLKFLPSGDARSALGFASIGRMPSPLRWKAFDSGVGASRMLKFRVFALPHAMPAESKQTMTQSKLLSAWGEVQRTLDAKSQLLDRIPAK